MEDTTNTNVNENQQTQTTTAPVNNSEVDYGKIEEIISKNTAKKENSILKSYFEQQGMDEQSIAQAINDYKANKANQEANMQANSTAMQQEIESYKAQIRDMEFKNTLSLECLNQKIDPKNIEYIQKMIDSNGVFDKDGKVDSSKVAEQLTKLLTAFPALKPATEVNKSGIVNIGANLNNNNNQSQVQSPNVPQKRWNRFR